MNRYSESLAEHMQEPRHRGPLADADLRGAGSLCGTAPFVHVYLRVRDGLVTRATFEAWGCGFTIAAGSILTELVQDKSLEECAQIEPDTIMEALEGFPVDKRYCAHVVVDALRAALKERGT